MNIYDIEFAGPFVMRLINEYSCWLCRMLTAQPDIQPWNPRILRFQSISLCDCGDHFIIINDLAIFRSGFRLIRFRKHTLSFAEFFSSLLPWIFKENILLFEVYGQPASQRNSIKRENINTTATIFVWIRLQWFWCSARKKNDSLHFTWVHASSVVDITKRKWTFGQPKV